MKYKVKINNIEYYEEIVKDISIVNSTNHYIITNAQDCTVTFYDPDNSIETTLSNNWYYTEIYVNNGEEWKKVWIGYSNPYTINRNEQTFEITIYSLLKYFEKSIISDHTGISADRGYIGTIKQLLKKIFNNVTGDDTTYDLNSDWFLPSVIEGDRFTDSGDAKGGINWKIKDDEYTVESKVANSIMWKDGNKYYVAIVYGAKLLIINFDDDYSWDSEDINFSIDLIDLHEKIVDDNNHHPDLVKLLYYDSGKIYLAAQTTRDIDASQENADRWMLFGYYTVSTKQYTHIKTIPEEYTHVHTVRNVEYLPNYNKFLFPVYVKLTGIRWGTIDLSGNITESSYQGNLQKAPQFMKVAYTYDNSKAVIFYQRYDKNYIHIYEYDNSNYTFIRTLSNYYLLNDRSFFRYLNGKLCILLEFGNKWYLYNYTNNALHQLYWRIPDADNFTWFPRTVHVNSEPFSNQFIYVGREELEGETEDISLFRVTDENGTTLEYQTKKGTFHDDDKLRNIILPINSTSSHFCYYINLLNVISNNKEYGNEGVTQLPHLGFLSNTKYKPYLILYTPIKNYNLHELLDMVEWVGRIDIHYISNDTISYTGKYFDTTNIDYEFDHDDYIKDPDIESINFAKFNFNGIYSSNKTIYDIEKFDEREIKISFPTPQEIAKITEEWYKLTYIGDEDEGTVSKYSITTLKIPSTDYNESYIGKIIKYLDPIGRYQTGKVVSEEIDNYMIILKLNHKLSNVVVEPQEVGPPLPSIGSWDDNDINIERFGTGIVENIKITHTFRDTSPSYNPITKVIYKIFVNSYQHGVGDDEYQYVYTHNLVTPGSGTHTITFYVPNLEFDDSFDIIAEGYDSYGNLIGTYNESYSGSTTPPLYLPQPTGVLWVENGRSKGIKYIKDGDDNILIDAENKQIKATDATTLLDLENKKIQNTTIDSSNSVDDDALSDNVIDVINYSSREAGNLIDNGTFERNGSAYKYYWRKSYEWEVVEDSGAPTKYVCKITRSGSDKSISAATKDMSVTKYFRVNPGELLILRFTYKTSGSTLKMGFAFYDENLGNTSYSYANLTSSNWEDYEYKAVVPSGKKWVRVFLGAYDNDGYVMVTNIRLTKAPNYISDTDGNILVDGSTKKISNDLKNQNGYSIGEATNRTFKAINSNGYIASNRVLADSFANGVIYAVENLNPSFEDDDGNGEPEGWSFDGDAELVPSGIFGKYYWKLKCAPNATQYLYSTKLIPVGNTTYYPPHQIIAIIDANADYSVWMGVVPCDKDGNCYEGDAITSLVSTFTPGVIKKHTLTVKYSDFPSYTRYIKLFAKLKNEYTTDRYLYLHFFAYSKLYVTSEIYADQHLSMNSKRITGLGTPVSGNDAVNKNYVDPKLGKVYGIYDSGDEPTCNASNEGMLIIVKEDTGTVKKAIFKICLQSGDSSYSWKTIVENTW